MQYAMSLDFYGPGDNVFQIVRKTNNYYLTKLFIETS